MEKGEDVHTAQLGKWWLEGVEVVNGRKTDCTWSGKRRRVLQVEKRLLDKKSCLRRRTTSKRSKEFVAGNEKHESKNTKASNQSEEGRRYV